MKIFNHPASGLVSCLAFFVLAYNFLFNGPVNMTLYFIWGMSAVLLVGVSVYSLVLWDDKKHSMVSKGLLLTVSAAGILFALQFLASSFIWLVKQ